VIYVRFCGRLAVVSSNLTAKFIGEIIMQLKIAANQKSSWKASSDVLALKTSNAEEALRSSVSAPTVRPIVSGTGVSCRRENR